MRTQQIKQILAEGMFAVEPRFLQGLIDTINSGSIETKAETDNSYSEAHSYEVIGNIAVITVDGATTKKNTWINARCGGFVGYDTIANYIVKAEGDVKVEKILLHLDTVGGDVAGVDNLQELIKTCTKETITLYDNIGTSAGIWYGTASDKVYATPMTQLGSIGVMAGYYEPREDDRKVVLVSRNANNKNCLLNGDCKDKFQSRIDAVEETFHERVSVNTGLTKEEIISHFNYGDVISSQEALKIGFIDGITSKKDLLKSLATMPSTEKIANSTKGITVTKQEEALQALLDTANATIDAKDVEIDGKDKEIATLTDSATALTAQVEKLTDEVKAKDGAVDDAIAAKIEIFDHAVAVVVKMDASSDTLVLASKADSKEAVDSIVLNAMDSEGASFKPSGSTEKGGAAIAAYAEANAGKVK